MRTTKNTARGKPLAVCLLFLLLAGASGAAWGEGTLAIEQTLTPAEIHVAGTGVSPTVATLSMKLVGQGAVDRFPLDCVIVVDASATSQLSLAKQFALDFVNRLGSEDRVGVVSFATTAVLQTGLTSDRAAAKIALGNIGGGDKSALGAGLLLARRELQQNGREEAVLAVLLLADGQNNVGEAPTVEGQLAGETGVRIVSVGIGDLINRALLQDLADASGGLFFVRPSMEALDAIVSHLEVRTAASSIEIHKRLPEGVRFVGAAPGPTQTRTERDGTTLVVWKLADLSLGQELRIDVRLEATEKGTWPTDEGSVVVYRDYRYLEREVGISPLRLVAVTPNIPPVAAFDVLGEEWSTAEAVGFADRSADVEDGWITGWRWTFGDGGASTAAAPEHRYAASGTYTVTLVVVDDRGAESLPASKTVVVGNARPVASFALRDADTMELLDRPRVGLEFILDGTSSYDLDGRVVAFAWDMDGDGVADVESTDGEGRYTVTTPGEHVFSLLVTDDLGGAASASRTFDVLSSVSAVRLIETCMPDDRTIGGAVATVTVTVTANATLNGIAVSETIPAGWTFTSIETDGATLKTSGTVAEWVFTERFAETTSDVHREIKYTLKAPATCPEERQMETIRGYAGSSSPRVSIVTGGEDKLTLVRYLPVPVVISRWNTVTSAVELCLGDRIAFDQIQYAVALWISGATVPQTNNAVVDLPTLQDLIAYWLTGS
ncbi:MAG: PKD domain-containing protein, partial [Candidatus Bipolaricaulota bacterium]